jgi:hypothetical protein
MKYQLRRSSGKRKVQDVLEKPIIVKSPIPCTSSKYKAYVKRAKEKDWPMEFTESQFLYFINNNTCVYCGSKATGIDRRINSIGYTFSNSQPCCGKCNMMKYNHSHERFVEHITKIYKHLNS